MIINELKVIQIFIEMDDFVSACEKFVGSKLIGSASPHAVNEPGITVSEMMCIELMYHLSGYKCFEYYYQQVVEKGSLGSYFPKAPCYNRFCTVETTHIITDDLLSSMLSSGVALRVILC